MGTSCYIHWIRISFLSVHCLNSWCCKCFLFIDTLTWEEIADLPTGDGNGQANTATAAPCVYAGHTGAAVGTYGVVGMGTKKWVSNRLVSWKTDLICMTKYPTYSTPFTPNRHVIMTCVSWRQRSPLLLLFLECLDLWPIHLSLIGQMYPLVCWQKYISYYNIENLFVYYNTWVCTFATHWISFGNILESGLQIFEKFSCLKKSLLLGVPTLKSELYLKWNFGDKVEMHKNACIYTIYF